MAIFRSVKALISQSFRNRSNWAPSRAFFSLSITSPYPISSPFVLPGNGFIRGHFLFRSRFLSPVVGPLFLSNPPWQLSQSATPLLLQSDAVLNFLKLRALNLLHRPAFPYELCANLRLLKKNRREEVNNDAQVIVSSEDNELRLSYFNLPNYISFARLLSGPVLGWMIIHDMYSPAFIGLAISGASDWLDGYVARKMRINSAVGSYLDPLADKVLIGCVALAMVDKDLLHPGLTLILLRDVGLVGGAIYKRASSLNWQWNSWRDFFDLNGADVEKVEPLFISKVNTFFQLVLVAAALLQPGFGNEETQLWIQYLSFLVAFTTVASTAAYAVQYRRFGFAITKKPTSIN